MPTENTAGTETTGRLDVVADAEFIALRFDGVGVAVAGKVWADLYARIAASHNALSELTVEAIEKIQPMDFAAWKVLASRVAELEAALSDGHVSPDHDSIPQVQHPFYYTLQCIAEDMRGTEAGEHWSDWLDDKAKEIAALAAIPATNAKEGTNNV